jgi:hypothetical protein
LEVRRDLLAGGKVEGSGSKVTGFVDVALADVGGCKRGHESRPGLDDLRIQRCKRLLKHLLGGLGPLQPSQGHAALADQPSRTEEGRSWSAGAVLVGGAANGRVGGIKGDQRGALVAGQSVSLGLKGDQPGTSRRVGIEGLEAEGLALEPAESSQRPLPVGRLDTRAADQVRPECAVVGLLGGLDASAEVGGGRAAVLHVEGKPSGQSGCLAGDGAELPMQGSSGGALEE